MPERFAKDAKITPKVKRSRIPSVKPCLFSVGEKIASSHLRESRDPRAKTVSSASAAKQMDLLLARNEGTRTDKTHLSAKHVEELRKLVKATSPQKAPDRCDVASVP